MAGAIRRYNVRINFYGCKYQQESSQEPWHSSHLAKYSHRRGRNSLPRVCGYLFVELPHSRSTPERNWFARRRSCCRQSDSHGRLEICYGTRTALSRKRPRSVFTRGIFVSFKSFSGSMVGCGYFGPRISGHTNETTQLRPGVRGQQYKCEQQAAFSLGCSRWQRSRLDGFRIRLSNPSRPRTWRISVESGARDNSWRCIGPN